MRRATAGAESLGSDVAKTAAAAVQKWAGVGAVDSDVSFQVLMVSARVIRRFEAMQAERLIQLNCV